MSIWAPLQSYAQDPGATDSLNPYFAFVLLSTTTLFTTLKPSPVAIFIYWCEEQGDSRGAAQQPTDYFSLSPTQHAFGFVGGFVWAVGTLSNLVAGSVVDLAISYSMAQAAPLVAMGWGVLYYREFKGASQAAYTALIAMVVLYGSAIGFIASSK